jgi:hypothetical protein
MYIYIYQRKKQGVQKYERKKTRSVWRAGYIPGDRLTSWVYSTTCVQYLYISCYLSDNKPVLSYIVVLASTVVTPIRLDPLYCTLYFCTLTPTCQQPSAPVALSAALVSDFLFQVLQQCALHWLQLSQHFFACDFV